MLGGLDHPVRPELGQTALFPASGDADPDPAQILDDGQTQHDGDRPQLAEAQVGDGLVGGDEAAQRFRINPSVAMRHGFQGNVVHARMADRWPAGQARQFAAVAFGQVALGSADLLFDEVKIVEQPFASRRDPAFFGSDGSQSATDIDQRIFVGRQPAEQTVGDGAGGEPVRGGQRLAVLRHLVGAVQGGA